MIMTMILILILIVIRIPRMLDDPVQSLSLLTTRDTRSGGCCGWQVPEGT